VSYNTLIHRQDYISSALLRGFPSQHSDRRRYGSNHQRRCSAQVCERRWLPRIRQRWPLHTARSAALSRHILIAHGSAHALQHNPDALLRVPSLGACQTV
ncbi:hypothetical protein PMAYCL1PPCAC_16105, partial [Pristionchus mayeri]